MLTAEVVCAYGFEACFKVRYLEFRQGLRMYIPWIVELGGVTTATASWNSVDRTG